MKVDSSEPIFVLDSSFTIAWILEEEGEEEHTDSVFSLLKESTALIPSLWFYEVANVLAIARRRGRLSQKDLTRALTFLKAIPTVVDPDGDRRALEILDLAESHTLTIYDTTYLDLAMRMGIPLATLDSALIQASHSLGVKVL